MKMVGLPRGRQHGVHGPAVNVPANVDKICSLLPRLPKESQIIPLKFKRRREYNTHYYYEFVNTEKVLDGLRYLKRNNVLYKDIKTNGSWVDEAQKDDPQLWSAMTNCDNDPSCGEDDVERDHEITTIKETSEHVDAVTLESMTQSDKETLEATNCKNPCVSILENEGNVKRKDDNNEVLDQDLEINSVPDDQDCAEKTNEQRESAFSDRGRKPGGITFEVIASGDSYYGSLEKLANENAFKIVDVANNGDRLFASVCYQLERLGVDKQTATQLRRNLATFMEVHAEHYIDFVCARLQADNRVNADTEQPTREDRAIAKIGDVDTRKQIQWIRYRDALEYERQWGEHIAAQAIADFFGLRIYIHSTDSGLIEVHSRYDVLH